MLKKYLKEQGKTIYALSRESGVAYSTLNDLANGKVEIEQCKVSLLRRMSAALGVSLEECIRICSADEIIVPTAYGIDAKVNVHNKSYHAEFAYDNETIDLELCKVREDTSFYLDEIAAWRVEEYIRERRLEEWG